MPSENGAIVRCERMTFESNRYGDRDVYRVIYRTSTRVTQGGVTTDVAIPASGTVVVPRVPEGAPAPTPRPIIAQTHGLTGIIGRCAPSFWRNVDDFGLVKQLEEVTGTSIVVAPDYVGLGIDHGARVPDVNQTVPDWFYFNQPIRPFSSVTHPFVSRVGEGRATVDLVRAARSIPDWSAGSSWVVVGQSQGGHAALSTAEVVKQGYDSELRLRAVIAGAPATEFEDRGWDPGLKNGVEAMVTVSATLENRDLRATSYLNSRAASAFYYTSNSNCMDLNGLIGLWALYGAAGNPWLRDPYSDPAALAVIRENSPGNVGLDIPAFVGVVQGDPLISRTRTRAFVSRARGNGSDVTYCEYAPLSTSNYADNHNAFKAMKNPLATCYDQASPTQNAQKFSDGKSVTMREWFGRNYTP